ncbi:hypothetical protein [Victivallis vadensis]|uniref:Dolichyl-phosphate-mannose-protein mannosyltransferase n=2 Tax=Victivallis vadensis TaxID=172901 RepID=A0A2U1AUC9_9BACT|nr:hypothetical protein [Victivallis vadensis]PVY40028.1 hypothetical protein C8D82_11827 [Victivallis vadensis]
MSTQTKPDADQRTRFFRLLWIGTLLAGALLRISGLFSSLEYDEIWTLESFAPQPLSVIFTDLALPNNHPLNTLGVKLCIACFDNPCLIRLPALLTGLGSLLLFPVVAFLWTRRRGAALAATFFFAFSHMAIGYAAQARGYGLQLFFLLLFCAGLQLSGRYRPKRYRHLPEAMVFLGGAGAVLTLPTSILYLAPAALLGWHCWRKRPFPCQPLKIVLAAGVVLTAGWYLLNYHALRAAQVWGTPVTGAGQFLTLVSDTLLHLNGPVVLLLASAGILLRFRRAWPLLVITAIPFLSAIATNAGGVRVYLPLVVPGALLAGMGLEAIYRRFSAKKRRLAAVFTICLVGLFLLNWYDTAPQYKAQDWFSLYDQIRKLSPEYMIALDAGDGYPYTWNNMPNAYKDYDLRLRNTMSQRELISFLPPNHLNGTDRHGASQRFQLNFQPEPEQQELGGFRVCRYRLTELRETPRPHSVILLVLRPLPVEVLRQYTSAIHQAYPEVLNLNPWLASAITVRGNVYQGCTLLFRCDDPSRLDWSALRSRVPDAVGIYQITPADGKNQK